MKHFKKYLYYTISFDRSDWPRSVFILNYNEHWGCVTTIGCGLECIRVYDGVYPSPSSVLIKKICVLLCIRKGKKSTIESVQEQTSSIDSGLLAISNVLA